MRKAFPLEGWKRKDHFEFFKSFDEPFFGLTTRVECADLFQFCKSEGQSFFLHYLYRALGAANALDCFKLRYDGEQVWLYDAVHASPTINRPNGTFGFSYINYYEDFEEYLREAVKEIERVQSSSGLEPAMQSENVIHFSSIPWIHFSALSHARSFKHPDSCPKITFGKAHPEEDKVFLPIAIHAHHALVDGSDLAEFLELFQGFLHDLPDPQS